MKSLFEWARTIGRLLTIVSCWAPERSYLSLRPWIVLACIWGMGIVGLAQIPQVKLENPQYGTPSRKMGYAVAVDGNRMIVGAPDTKSHFGLARIYVRDASGHWEYESELFSSSPVSGDFGNAVAISGDTAIVGAYHENYYGWEAGAVYIYRRAGGVWTQQAQLHASDPGEDDNFGCSVAISGDTVLIGAKADDNVVKDSGSVYVFTRSGETWTEQAKLTAGAGAISLSYFGYSVALSGNTAIIGVRCDDAVGDASGSAYIFTRESGAWVQQAKLTASDAASGDLFGHSVAIDGDTVIIGADGDDDAGSKSGSAYVFTRSGSTWTQQAKLAAADAAWEDWFGCSVAVRGDKAVIGALNDDDGGAESGSAYIFTRSGGLWTPQTKLTATDAAAGDYFGCSVALADDMALVGAYNAIDNAGSVSAYVCSSGIWSFQDKLNTEDPAAEDRFGWSVAISGNTAIVGAVNDDEKGPDVGAAYIFTITKGVWALQAKLMASDAIYENNFGAAVAIAGDTAFVGSPKINGGSVYVFTRSGNTWTQQAKLTAADQTPSDEFGNALAISGDTLIVGAHLDDDGGGESGSAYIFIRSGSDWVQQAKLTAVDAAGSDWFGSSVALSGETAVVGAHGDDDAGIKSGSAYVFVRAGENWVQQAKLTAEDAAAGAFFGMSVAISGETVLVGASGKGYIFSRSAGVWTQQANLTAADGMSSDGFGNPVTLLGDHAVIGAGGADDGLNNSGAVYLFDRDSDSWTQSAKLKAADAAVGDRFGYTVAIDAGWIIVGAPDKDDPEAWSGAAYIDTFDPSAITAATSWMGYE